GTIFGSIFLFRAFDVFDLHFQARVLSKYTVWATSASFLLIATTKLVLIRRNATLVAFAWADFAGGALPAIALMVVYRSTGGQPLSWRFEAQRARRMLTAGWPVMLSSVAIVIYMKIDQVMLKRMLGADAAGLYSAATRISEIWYFIPMVVTS